MTRLLITSLIWAFSFSLIGQYIAGKMDTYIAILLRFGIALLFFIPFLRIKGLGRNLILKQLGIGALQIGVMYIFYFNSFLYLSVSEVALFTITTPLYVSLIGSSFEKNFEWKKLINICLVILGAAVIKYKGIDDNFVIGFLLVQAANLSFACGQCLYKRIMPSKGERGHFGLFYLGAMIPIIPMALIYSDFSNLPQTSIQWCVLVWLGAMASALGYYLWNSGAKKVSFNQLAVMNNAVIPLAILVNVFVWNQNVDWIPFLVGGLILCSGTYLELRKSLPTVNRGSSTN